jgi:hypothetical protein
MKVLEFAYLGVSDLESTAKIIGLLNPTHVFVISGNKEDYSVYIKIIFFLLLHTYTLIYEAVQIKKHISFEVQILLKCFRKPLGDL